MIRAAVLEDIPEMVRMGKRFHALTPSAHTMEFDDESFSETLLLLIPNSNNCVLVVDDGELCGMACAILMDCFFNKHRKICQELFCWVDEEKRGQGMMLFETLEDWALYKKAKIMIIALVPTLRSKALDRLYRARGFILTDSFYTKVL